jgi:hypothetical protein
VYIYGTTILELCSARGRIAPLKENNISDAIMSPECRAKSGRQDSKQFENVSKTPWSESASELYRPSDRRFSAKCCQLVRIEGATWSV